MKKEEKESDSTKENSDKPKEIEEIEQDSEEKLAKKTEEDNIDLISSVVDDFNEVEKIEKPSKQKPVELLIQQGPGEKIEKKAQKYLEKQKDYAKYEAVQSNYPLFLQLPNACGLSSILMLIDPVHNEQVGKLLTQVWEHVEKIMVIEQSRKEFKWAFALDYLLLKSATPNALFDYIQSLKTEDLQHYYIGLESVLRFQQQEHLKVKENFVVNAYEDFFTHGLITQFILTRHTDLFKHNPEIQILMAIFGYEFVRQPAPDGTGALFFTAEELKNIELSSAKKKIKVLRSEYIKGARIIVGFSFHWVALTNVFTSSGKIHISINDPAGEKYEIPLTNLSDRDRFYIYRKTKTKPKKLWNQILKIIEEDGPREIALGEEFMKMIEDRVKIDTEPTEDGDIQINIQLNPEGKRTPLRDTVKQIPVKVHEDAVKSIETSKKLAESESIKPEKEVSEEEETNTSSKEAFKKKMRKIIGDQFRDYEDR